MGNMSYCRFENTFGDVLDCLDALRDRNVLSKSELENAGNMLMAIIEFLQEEEIIDRYNNDALENLLDECE
jgi:hypothetical protein